MFGHSRRSLSRMRTTTFLTAAAGSHTVLSVLFHRHYRTAALNRFLSFFRMASTAVRNLRVTSATAAAVGSPNRRMGSEIQSFIQIVQSSKKERQILLLSTQMAPRLGGRVRRISCLIGAGRQRRCRSRRSR